MLKIIFKMIGCFIPIVMLAGFASMLGCILSS